MKKSLRGMMRFAGDEFPQLLAEARTELDAEIVIENRDRTPSHLQG